MRLLIEASKQITMMRLVHPDRCLALQRVSTRLVQSTPRRPTHALVLFLAPERAAQGGGGWWDQKGTLKCLFLAAISCAEHAQQHQFPFSVDEDHDANPEENHFGTFQMQLECLRSMQCHSTFFFLATSLPQGLLSCQPHPCCTALRDRKAATPCSAVQGSQHCSSDTANAP